LPYDYQNWRDPDYGDEDGTALTLRVDAAVDAVNLVLAVEDVGVETSLTFTLAPDVDLDAFIQHVVELRNATRRNRDVMHVQII
jgi:hypothetical protein